MRGLPRIYAKVGLRVPGVETQKFKPDMKARFSFTCILRLITKSWVHRLSVTHIRCAQQGGIVSATNEGIPIKHTWRFYTLFISNCVTPVLGAVHSYSKGAFNCVSMKNIQQSLSPEVHRALTTISMENIIFIWICPKLGSVGPVNRKINLVSP